MSQVTVWPIPSGPSGLEMRQQTNLLIEALRTKSSGSSAPTPTVGGMMWFDTSVTPGLLKMRNEANTAWILVLLDNSNLILSKSGDYTLSVNDRNKTIRATDDITLTIPAAATAGNGFTFSVLANGGVITFAGGNTSIVIDDGASSEITCNGSAYYALSGNLGGGGGLFKGNNGEVGDAPGDIFRINAKSLSVNTTIDADENASATGPLTIADGVTLTITSGGVLSIV